MSGSARAGASDNRGRAALERFLKTLEPPRSVFNPNLPDGRLGVEDGYSADIPINSREGGAVNVSAPAYKPAAYTPAHLEAGMALAPDELAHVQDALARAGLLSGEYRSGWPDSKTKTAYKKLLEMSNRVGTPWQMTLQNLIAGEDGSGGGGGGGRRGGGGGGGGRAPLTVQLSNPEDLKKVFSQVALATTGVGKIDDADADAMVAAFQQHERSFQQRAFNAIGGEIVAAPSVQSFAADEIDELDEGGVAAKRYADNAQALIEALGAPV